MRLYIDGDALPNLLKPVLIKSINRLKIDTLVVANKKINIGKSEYVSYEVVDSGLDVADNHIVTLVNVGDLVITADIPLADKIVTKGAYAIDHRGELYNENNIKQYLTMRNLMQELRDSGEIMGGPKPFSKQDVHQFANQLNSFLAKVYK
jgi:uncharacterized protein YaiI (UPF0178 family)